MQQESEFYKFRLELLAITSTQTGEQNVIEVEECLSRRMLINPRLT
jgi:hypothetical protein